MPRSFLVKKYLKQKYDADFKLQQSLNNNNNVTDSESNSSGDILDNQSNQQISLKSNDCTTNTTTTDSGKAATPFTPSLVQPLAVRLSNGYILDMSHSNSLHNVGDAESSHTIARTPKHEHESAARENQQPRRSVIVTNSNHPANRNVHSQKTDNSDINNSSRISSNDHVSTYTRHYEVSPSIFGYKGQGSYLNSQTSLDRPSMAHMPSPPPAHTPVPSSPLPAHISVPAPAHTSTVSHTLNLCTTPTPALIPSSAYSFTPQSPSPAHLNHSRTSPRPEVLPADHPINHPLIQHFISQRLHVPEEDTTLSHNKESQDIHEPMDHQAMRASYSPPHDKEDVYMRRENNENQLRRVNYTVFPPGNENSRFEHRANESDASRLTAENSSQSMSSAISQNHFPPSPSPSLPSSSPTLPGLISSFTHTSPPSPALSLPPPSPQSATSGSETNAYTYEAFLVSDGRSRKRAMTDEADVNSNGRVRYTCSDCGKDYATSSNLSRHKQTHRSLDSKNAKKCPHCDKVYVSMPALSMHVLTHDLKHSCKVCGKTFSRPWLLQGHMRSHTGEKPFGCAHCGKAFADRSNLRAHMQTHSAFKHFACDKCNKTFALKSYLNKHLESACVKDQ